MTGALTLEDLAPAAPHNPVAPRGDKQAEEATSPVIVARVLDTQRDTRTPQNDPSMLDRPNELDTGREAHFDFSFYVPVDHWPEKLAPSIPTLIDTRGASDQRFEQGGAVPQRRAPMPHPGRWDGAWTV